MMNFTYTAVPGSVEVLVRCYNSQARRTYFTTIYCASVAVADAIIEGWNGPVYFFERVVTE